MPYAPPFKRADFITRFVAAGLKYREAEIAYQAMLGSFSDAIAGARPVIIGQVGAIRPRAMKARTVIMGMRRLPGKPGKAATYRREKREYILGARTVFKFCLFKRFGQKAGLTP